ncbi:MAG: type II toxin-antitoxin system MqsA family antitoxin [Chrysiogenetes bacterium]|nr:type II toxin-antitoxin system MqsA family antitoxin [Chrysiogenetes bacterium]
MKCPFCKHGETREGTTTVTLERGETTVVFKDVPAEVCVNCGEALVSEEVSASLLSQAQTAATAGVEVEVRHYVAA